MSRALLLCEVRNLSMDLTSCAVRSSELLLASCICCRSHQVLFFSIMSGYG